MRFLAGVLCALIFAGAAAAQPVNSGHIVSELVAEAPGIAPGQTLRVALRQQIRKGWHTYWRNAGDSGEPTRLTWTLPAGWSASGFDWPAPARLPVGPLMNYGYQGEVLLPLTVTAPQAARPGETVALKAHAQFLVCAELCVPEEADLTLALPVKAAPAAPDPRWAPAIARALDQAPKAAGLTAAFAREGPLLKLAVTGPAVAGGSVSDAYFYPYSGAVIDHARPQAVERGPRGLTLALAASPDLQHGRAPQTLQGALVVDGHAYEVAAAPGPLPPGAAGLGPPPAKASAGPALRLPLAALYALVGGLILNLMPCVFPILAMKAAALAHHAHNRTAARGQGLAFAVGAVTAFLALAVTLVALKQAGAAAGWGFQLQSPAVVAALALLMLLVALNLSGLFEVGTSLQGVGSDLAARAGLTGAFFTGALAVVVAAPCTAPFMGPAIGWALVQPAPETLAVFAALGLGFAAPFVAVAFAPALLTRLPRPGPWMDGFKKALAFPMYGAAAWLLWVLAQQADAEMLARALAGAVLLAAAAWLWGAAQRRRAEGAPAVSLGGAAALLGACALAAALWPAAAPDVAPEPYSPGRLAALQAEGRPVFVNYTAAWCVSCQVNDRVAISTPGAAAAFRRTRAAYLRADWTRRDPAIAADLARFGRAGVPLYLVYGARGGEPAILPAILTEGVVVRALDAAAR